MAKQEPGARRGGRAELRPGDEDRAVYIISVAAELAGVHPQTLRIYERNMNLHLNLIGKIQQMEAMKLGGVDEAKIDQIVMDFEEKLEKYAAKLEAQ